MENQSPRDILPPNFVSFIQKNYENIAHLENKIKEFQENAWKTYSYYGRQAFRKDRLFCDSLDSCKSTKDNKKIITAKLVPKFKKVDSLDRIFVDASFLEEYEPSIHEAEVNEELETLHQKFPLVSFESPPIAIEIKKEEKNKLHKYCDDLKFMHIEGRPIQITERDSSPHMNPFTQSCNDRENVRLKNKAKKKSTYSKPCTNPMGQSEKGKKMGRKNKVASNGSKSLKMGTSDHVCPTYSQKSLPPLHSSVLTLLGLGSSLSKGDDESNIPVASKQKVIIIIS